MTPSPLQPVTVITGASSGIGAALARIFGMNGHRLALVARREAQLNGLADSIAAEGRERPQVIAVDLAASNGPQQLADQLMERGLEPAVIVNNAGIGLYGPAAELDLTRQLAMIDLDVRALTDLSLRFLDSLERHQGGLLNVASIAGFMPGPGMAVYHACKAHVVSLSEALHAELKPRGIRVSVLCPGPVLTEFMGQAGIGDSHFPRYLFRSADRVAHDGYHGFMRGQRIIIPGSHNRGLVWLARVLPRSILLDMVQNTGAKTARRTG